MSVKSALDESQLLDSDQYILLLGDPATGKTTLLHKFHAQMPDAELILSGDAPELVFQKNNVPIHILDYPKTLSSPTSYKEFFQKTTGAFILIDLTNTQTCTTIMDWVTTMIRYAGKMFPIVVLGNKAEEPSSDEISTETILSELYELGDCTACKLPYFEISALQGTNVDLALGALVLMMDCQNRVHCAQKASYFRRSCDVKHYTPISPLMPI